MNNLFYIVSIFFIFMKKLFVFFVLFLSLVSYGYSLNTYVGVKIIDLKDDPSNSCASESGYNSQGRIQALSSILPDYPIYMEIRNLSGTPLYSGNVSDNDYVIGDTIFFPNEIDLTIGENYSVFFDVDAIRFFLNLPPTHSMYSGPIFTRNLDNNYWSIGNKFTLVGDSNGKTIESDTSGCQFERSWGWGPNVNHYKNRSMVGNTSCTMYDCFKTLDYSSDNSKSFRINGLYSNIYQPTIGNFNVGFTFE